MLGDKQTVISELESRGEKELVEQAPAKLPDQVHLGGHAVQLRELGLDPDALASKFSVNAPPSHA